MRVALYVLVIAALVAVASAGYGDVDASGSPNADERSLLVAFNFLRSDPAWWQANIFGAANPFVYYSPQNNLRYDSRLAASARLHAQSMATNSPSTCAAAQGTCPNCRPPAIAPDTTVYCCLRPQTCTDPTQGPDARIKNAGFDWSITPGGWGEALSANPAAGNAFAIVGNIVCAAPNPSLPNNCAPSDQGSNTPVPSRGQTTWSPSWKVTGPGYGFSATSKFINYYVLDFAYNGNPSDCCGGTNNPIAAATWAPWSAQTSGFLLNWIGAGGANPSVYYQVGSGPVQTAAVPQIGTGLNYFLTFPATQFTSCTQVAFGAALGSTWYRYPEQSNLQFGTGCTGTATPDTATCGNCNGICFRGACQGGIAPPPGQNTGAPGPDTKWAGSYAVGGCASCTTSCCLTGTLSIQQSGATVFVTSGATSGCGSVTTIQGVQATIPSLSATTFSFTALGRTFTVTRTATGVSVDQPATTGCTQNAPGAAAYLAPIAALVLMLAAMLLL